VITLIELTRNEMIDETFKDLIYGIEHLMAKSNIYLATFPYARIGETLKFLQESLTGTLVRRKPLKESFHH